MPASPCHAAAMPYEYNHGPACALRPKVENIPCVSDPAGDGILFSLRRAGVAIFRR